jgi:hypothetical protein
LWQLRTNELKRIEAKENQYDGVIAAGNGFIIGSRAYSGVFASAEVVDGATGEVRSFGNKWDIKALSSDGGVAVAYHDIGDRKTRFTVAKVAAGQLEELWSVPATLVRNHLFSSEPGSVYVNPGKEWFKVNTVDGSAEAVPLLSWLDTAEALIDRDRRVVTRDAVLTLTNSGHVVHRMPLEPPLDEKILPNTHGFALDDRLIIGATEAGTVFWLASSGELVGSLAAVPGGAWIFASEGADNHRSPIGLIGKPNATGLWCKSGENYYAWEVCADWFVDDRPVLERIADAAQWAPPQ